MTTTELHRTFPAPRRLPASRRGVLVLASLALVLDAVQASQRQDPASETWPLVEELREILPRTSAGDRVVRAEALEQLVALGPQAAPTLWALRTGQVLEEQGLDHDVAALRSAFERWSGPETVELVRGSVQEDAGVSMRVVAIEMIAWTSCDEAIPALLEVAQSTAPTDRSSGRLAAGLERVLPPLLVGSPRRFHQLVDELAQLSPELLVPVASAVGGLCRPESLLVLSRIHELAPELEESVLREISENAPGFSPGPAIGCVGIARRFLDDENPRSRRLAAVALGRLGDATSFARLIGHLEDEDPIVRRVSAQALQQLSGMPRTWAPARWESWHRGEHDWLEQNLGRLMTDITGSDAYLAHLALRELSTHRLFREDVVGVLAAGLRSQDASLRSSICEVLADLQDASGVGALIDRLDDPEQEVRSAALASLRSMTGIDLGEERRPWRLWWDDLG